MGHEQNNLLPISNLLPFNPLSLTSSIRSSAPQRIVSRQSCACILFDWQLMYRSKKGALLPSADSLQRKLTRRSTRRKLLAYRDQQHHAHQLKKKNHPPLSPSTSIILPSPLPPMHPRTRRITPPLQIPLSTTLLPCTRFRPPPCIEDEKEEEEEENEDDESTNDDSSPPAKRSRMIPPLVLPNHLRPLFLSQSIVEEVYDPDDPPLRLEWNQDE